MVNIEKLHEVFNTMAYEKKPEDSCKGKDGINTKLAQLFAEDSMEDISEKLKNHTFSNYEPKRKHLVGLAKELEKNVDVICQIESTSRGILAKDTKKAVDSLAQYLYYYAAFAKKHQFEDAINILGIFKDDHPIWILGLLLGPALASGFHVILQTGLKFASVTSYVLELAVNVGFPKNLILHVCSYTENLKCYHEATNRLTIPVIFANLQSESKDYGKYNFLSLIPQKAAMLVFQDADLNSTVENAIEAVWGYHGMLPWSVNTILIQESVFVKFTDKFTKKVEAIDSSDIVCPSSEEFLNNQANIVNKANSLGIKVFQKDNNGSPTIIIGAKVSQSVFTSEKNDGTVTLVPFRSIEEAVSLTNNRRQGLGASVWSENIGLVNEVARRLDVGVNYRNMFQDGLCGTYGKMI
ncbi:uncharacterized protein LOC126740736 isoform X3 [Anthonomus grandis grandis]|uniref:uncharacterized protein LOC126740736 isoform X3 n=1 Tax=Anthonomus grandis grandis TaxID=2921223 RepID=UPI002166C15C|nr:uncharacterized protein LOC126740736 isoform X3 [Anthonomus grandis grandis]